MFAVAAGLLFAIPWAAQVSAAVGGDPNPRPVLWHELHALAGVGFALSLVELRSRYRGWFGPSSRVALTLAIASAAAFAVANAGEVLTGVELFVVLYGVALIALSATLVAIGVSTRTLPRPLPALLVLTGIALPVAMALNAVPPPAGPIVVGAALLGYGLLWSGLGFVQLSRTP